MYDRPKLLARRREVPRAAGPRLYGAHRSWSDHKFPVRNFVRGLGFRPRQFCHCCDSGHLHVCRFFNRSQAHHPQHWVTIPVYSSSPRWLPPKHAPGR